MQGKIKMKSIISDKFEINLFFDNLNLRDAGKIIDKNVEEINDNEEIGYAGFLDKKYLISTIDKFSLDKNKNHKYFSVNDKLKERVVTITKDTLKELDKFSKSKKYVFIFPCLDNFTINQLGGVGGYCPWKNVILIFLYPSEGWEQNLKETLYHEFAHSINDSYKGGEFSLGEGFILEGLAEHFREKVLGGERAPYTRALSYDDVIKYLKKLKSKLKVIDFELYREVFFGTGEYPLWTGYSIGYYLVEKYLKDKKEIDWNELLRKNPKLILEKLLEF